MNRSLNKMTSVIQTNKYIADAALIGLRLVVVGVLVYSAFSKSPAVGYKGLASLTALTVFCLSALSIRVRYYRQSRFDLLVLAVEGLLTLYTFALLFPVERHLDYAYVFLIASAALQLGIRGGLIFAILMIIFDYRTMPLEADKALYSTTAVRHSLSMLAALAFGFTHHIISGKHRKIRELNRNLDDKVTVLVSATRIMGSMHDLEGLVAYFKETMTRVFAVSKFALVLQPEGGGLWREILGSEVYLPTMLNPLILEKSPIEAGRPVPGQPLVVGASHEGTNGQYLLLLEPEAMDTLESDRDLFLTVYTQFVLAIDHSILLEKAKEAALTDHLTGLFNQRYFWERLAEEAKRSLRTGHSLSILIIDVDDFKNYNDNHGHLNGDRALSQIAQSISSCCRETDLAARYGGEEFVVILPETDVDGAIEVARRIVAAVGQENFPSANEGTAELTVSVGVACYPDQGLEPREIIEQADRALYTAKALGKNQVVTSSIGGGKNVKQIRR
ncbi:MAG: GGDEF domain-containing protein [Candidatus Aquicultorales bacterium]